MLEKYNLAHSVEPHTMSSRDLYSHLTSHELTEKEVQNLEHYFTNQCEQVVHQLLDKSYQTELIGRGVTTEVNSEKNRVSLNKYDVLNHNVPPYTIFASMPERAQMLLYPLDGFTPTLGVTVQTTTNDTGIRAGIQFLSDETPFLNGRMNEKQAEAYVQSLIIARTVFQGPKKLATLIDEIWLNKEWFLSEEQQKIPTNKGVYIETSKLNILPSFLDQLSSFSNKIFGYPPIK